MRPDDIACSVRRRLMIAVLVISALALPVPGIMVVQAAGDVCRPDGGLTTVPDLVEGSGIAVSARVPGRLWAHNDSGPPMLLALDARSGATTRVNVSGAEVDDWEALAIGRCPAGSCLYIGDIGDNDAERARITVYRVPEPEAAARTMTVDAVFHAVYPDGAQDAEALLVSPDGQLFVATKGDQRPVTLYRFPQDAKPGATVTLERVGQPLTSGAVDAAQRVTDGAMSPDGRWIALRTLTTLTFYPAADAMKGVWRGARQVDLSALDEPQGEGVALAEDGAAYLAGEGGGDGRPGTLVRLTCLL